MNKKTIRVSYEYNIEYETKEGLDYLLKVLKQKPSFGLNGADTSDGLYRIDLEENTGEVCEFK